MKNFLKTLFNFFPLHLKFYRFEILWIETKSKVIDLVDIQFTQLEDKIKKNSSKNRTTTKQCNTKPKKNRTKCARIKSNISKCFIESSMEMFSLWERIECALRKLQWKTEAFQYKKKHTQRNQTKMNEQKKNYHQYTMVLYCTRMQCKYVYALHQSIKRCLLLVGWFIRMLEPHIMLNIQTTYSSFHLMSFSMYSTSRKLTRR